MAFSGDDMVLGCEFCDQNIEVCNCLTTRGVANKKDGRKTKADKISGYSLLCLCAEQSVGTCGGDHKRLGYFCDRSVDLTRSKIRWCSGKKVVGGG